MLRTDQRQQVDEGFAHSFGMRSRSKQEGILWKLGFELGDRSGTKARFHHTGTAALADKPDAVEDQVVLAAVLSLVFNRVDVVQIKMGEAGVDFVMAVIELNRPEFVSRGYDTIDLGDFGRFPRLRISAAKAANKTVRIRHVGDELHSVFDSLAEGRDWQEEDTHKCAYRVSHEMGGVSESSIPVVHAGSPKILALDMLGGPYGTETDSTVQSPSVDVAGEKRKFGVKAERPAM